MPTHPRSPRRRRPALLGAAVLLLVVAASCGDDDDGDAATGGDGAADAVTVDVDDNVFEPESVDVTTGATVTWEWVGNEPHNVSHDDFESDLQSDGTFEHTFDASGTFDYVCTVHPGMEGTVTVAD